MLPREISVPLSGQINVASARAGVRQAREGRADAAGKLSSVTIPDDVDVD